MKISCPGCKKNVVGEHVGETIIVRSHRSNGFCFRGVSSAALAIEIECGRCGHVWVFKPAVSQMHRVKCGDEESEG